MISALTDSARLRPLVEHLAMRFPNAAELDGGRLITWEAETYDVRRVPIARFMPGEPGFILLFSDVGARL